MGAFVYQDNFRPSGRLAERGIQVLESGIKYKGQWYALAPAKFTRALRCSACVA